MIGRLSGIYRLSWEGGRGRDKRLYRIRDARVYRRAKKQRSLQMGEKFLHQLTGLMDFQIIGNFGEEEVTW